MTEAWLDLDLVVPLGSGSLRARIVTEARVVGIVGPSGGGKTSLLRAIAGVNPRATGTLRVLGATWQEGRTFVPPWERRVGWVPQDALLFPHLDVRANLTYGGGADRVAEVAALLGIDALVDEAASSDFCSFVRARVRREDAAVRISRISRVLTGSTMHPRGIKVQLTCGAVGRVCALR